jgi:hypothetical protein
MRTLLTGSLFALALLVAACGGGGKSGMLPTLGGNASGGNQSSAANGKAAMVLYIPPPSKQDARKPLYISPGTQSFGVLAVSATSTATPDVTNEQIFPVATPSPCAAASGGGLTCTLNVTAPIGLDVFYVGAYATTSPGPHAIPIAEYIATGVNVSVSPSPGATPLSFTLNGVVYQVAITVASPDPGNTPNTQVFPAGVASQTYPLGIAAYDSSGNQILLDPTTPFADPIVIEASPASGGVGLETAGPSQCTSGAAASARRRMLTPFSGGSATVTIACAADLTNVEFGYDGTTTPDPNDHVVDTFTIASTTQVGPSPAPSPANVVLESNVIPYQIPLSAQTPNNALLTTLSNGQLLYIVNVDTAALDTGLIGTFAPSTATLSTPVTLNGVEVPSAMAVAPNGTFFVVDSQATISCWSSASSALSGALPAANTIIPPADPNGYVPQLYALTVDSANNVWAVGYEYQSGISQDYATYFPAAGGCNASPAFSAYVTLNGDTYDSSPFITPLNNGMVFSSQSGYGMYTATTTNAGGSVNRITPALGSGSNGGGVATGANGTVYASFFDYGSTGDLETLPSGGSSLSSLLTLVPTSPVSGVGPAPYGMSVFSLNGVPDRLAYADDDFYALGVVGNLTTTPATMLISLPNVYEVYQTTHNSKGGEYIMYEDSNDNMYLTRAIETTTWNVPVTSIATGVCGSLGLMSLNQRAPSSGPFTFAFPNGGSNTAVPGAYNDQVLSPPSNGTPFPVTVTDAGGRTETFTMTVTNNESC